MPASSEPGIVLTEADVALFAEASHDRSPIHVSAEYARQTPFGRPVVHGVLVGLACLARLARLPGVLDTTLTRLTLEFKAPVYAGVSYAIAVETRGNRTSVRLLDGGRLMLKLNADHAPGAGLALSKRTVPSRSTAAHRTLAELTEGTTLRGDYSPQPSALRALLERLALSDATSVSELHVGLLMAASYLVGMEAPGEPALLSRVAFDFTFREPLQAVDAALAYQLEVRENDARFELVRLSVGFERAGVPLARAEIDAYVRGAPKVLDVAALRRLSPPSTVLAGKVAIVVGASRGLGAAISVALADQACRVAANFAKSAAAAARVAAIAPDRIALLPADAEDPESFASTARAFAAAHGGLDVLVCNACPPLSALPLHLASVSRIADYVQRSFAMAAVPLAALLDLLEARNGTLVVVSSAAVVDPPPEWPHYVAAKGALEGLARTTAARGRIRVFVARPPRLDTDLMNTPGIHGDALSPETVAASIVSAVRAGLAAAPGRAVVLLDDFGVAPEVA